MAISENQKLIKKLLKTADVNIDGKRDQDIQVLDDRLYDRVMSEGSMGAGESYMDGWWRVKKLDKFFANVFTTKVDQNIASSIKLKLVFHYVGATLKNRQRGKYAYKNAQSHYDIGNDLYLSLIHI